MSLDYSTPFDRHTHAEPARLEPPALPASRNHFADLCYIAIKAGGFLVSTWLMALGLPLLFFLVISGGSAEVFFAQLANLAERFLGADPARQMRFLADFKFALIGLATIVTVWRMPRFLAELNAALREEKP